MSSLSTPLPQLSSTDISCCSQRPAKLRQPAEKFMLVSNQESHQQQSLNSCPGQADAHAKNVFQVISTAAIYVSSQRQSRQRALIARPELTHGKSHSLSSPSRARVKTINLPVGKIRLPVCSRTQKLGCNDPLPAPDPQDSHISPYKTLGNSPHLLAPST